MVCGQHRQIVGEILSKQPEQNGLEAWLKRYNACVPAVQVQSPEFDPQSHQKQTKNQTNETSGRYAYRCF
jgi:hypothetical protein